MKIEDKFQLIEEDITKKKLKSIIASMNIVVSPLANQNYIEIL